MEDIKNNEVKADNSSSKELRMNTYYESILNSFNESGNLPLWNNYNAVAKFKSVRRSIRRGHVDLFTGIIYPSRPFNNRKNTKGRKMNGLKKMIYEQFKARTV